MNDFWAKIAEDPTIKVIIQALPAIAIGLFGGLVALFTKADQKFGVRMFIGGLLAAALAGFLLDLIGRYFEWHHYIRVGSISMSGFCAKAVLDKLEKMFLDTIDKGGPDG